MAAKLARTLPSASTSIGAPLASTSTAPAATVAGQPEAFRRPLRAPIAPRFGARPPRTGRRTVDASSVELMPTPEARPERTRVSGWTARRGGRSTVFDPSESEIVATVGRFTAPIQLPPRLAVRACTHKSIVEGTTRNHNGRLAFMGRRALQFHLAAFFHANRHLLQPQDVPLSMPTLDALLNAQQLGDLGGPGRLFELERAMRWRQVVNELGVPTGLSTVRASCVEALAGAVWVHCGADVSSRFFGARMLPLLNTPPSLESAVGETVSSSGLRLAPPPAAPRDPSPAHLSSPSA